MHGAALDKVEYTIQHIDESREYDEDPDHPFLPHVLPSDQTQNKCADGRFTCSIPYNVNTAQDEVQLQCSHGGILVQIVQMAVAPDTILEGNYDD